MERRFPVKIDNPLFYADMPDILRVGTDFYMVTTTMFYMPAAPVQKTCCIGKLSLISAQRSQIMIATI